MKVLVLGVSGMLGSAVFYRLCRSTEFEVIGSARQASVRNYFTRDLHERIGTGVDVLDDERLTETLASTRPDVVINCIGVIKQLAAKNNPLDILPINSMLPHRLAAICENLGMRLIHISTDCVFDGAKGNYVESDVSNATDLYGKSKFIGELHDKANAITLRTSIIGHELNSKHGLIEWFLSQSGSINGFTRAIFSGLPTVELARVIQEYIIPEPGLSGLYHVSAEPISKFDLLSLVARIYAKEIEILPEREFVVDRSLDSARFRAATGYVAPEWPELVQMMKDSKIPSGT